MASALVLTVGFLVLRQITTSAFDGIEARQVAQDSDRLRIALEGQARVLTNYAVVNAEWDNTYDEVAASDRESFSSDLPADQLHKTLGIDALFGVGPDGTLHTGGIATSDAYAPPPADLGAPAVLTKLASTDMPLGTARCGVVSTSVAPFIFCSSPIYRSDGSGPPAGSLVALKALGADGLALLGKQVNLPLKNVAGIRAGSKAQSSLASNLGTIAVHTTATSGNQIAVDAAIPTVNGSPVVIESLRDRPIHQVANDTAVKIFVLMGIATVGLIIAVVLLVNRGIRTRVGPLRRTTEAVIASGDRSLRVGMTGKGDIPALAAAIDQMLDAMAAQDAQLQAEQATREEELARTFSERQRLEQETREQAQHAITQTTTLVSDRLAEVVGQVDAARTTTLDIDDRVETAHAATQRMVDEARQADQLVTDLTASLRRIGGIAELIAGVATQTNLLALNATIEAARAGEAGRGFAVVAGEVKALATTTSQSTGDITTMLAELEGQMVTVSAAITAMTDGIAAIDHTTTGVREASEQQRQVVERLGRQVEEAMDRVRTINQTTR
ncbi:hypothetical protein Pme01_01300 [Planosporangium mesophilum]|uniref:Methyl-accepting chemotaxis protein n=1 Tax=Planosporangium mesophilum TaxID=689768 RepID=A0A8J3T5A5_9ACTN|nr:hypothetical protein Pme01_01300 [Planosporangium mesophilum]